MTVVTFLSELFIGQRIHFRFALKKIFLRSNCRCAILNEFFLHGLCLLHILHELYYFINFAGNILEEKIALRYLKTQVNNIELNAK